MYRVIKHFTDLQDNNFEYNVGDIYPHGKKKVPENRVKELASCENRQGVPLIRKVEDPKSK